MAASAVLGTVAFAPVIQAVGVNPDGMGQVLIYP